MPDQVNIRPCNKSGYNTQQCCCNCKHQREIRGHPWNKGFGKGNIGEVHGWGCAGLALCADPNPKSEEFDNRRAIIFSDREHGMCSLWEGREALPSSVEAQVLGTENAEDTEKVVEDAACSVSHLFRQPDRKDQNDASSSSS